jgi:hypothetical protein
MVVVMATSDFLHARCTTKHARNMVVVFVARRLLIKSKLSRPICGESCSGIERELWEDLVTEGTP